MTTSESGLDFHFLAPADEAVETVEATGKQVEEKSAPPVAEESVEQDVLDEISSVLAPKEEPVTGSRLAAKTKTTTTTATDVESDEGGEAEVKSVRQPVMHNPQLLTLASSWGIGPDDAANYPNEEALLGAVALREIRWQKAAAKRDAESITAKTKDEGDGLPEPPKIELDEDIDPKIKSAIESSVAYARQVQERAAAREAELRKEIDTIRAEHEQAAERDILQTEAKIAQVFDEKVASWGDEFKEIIGVPQETWRNPKTPQYGELRKLREYAMQRKVGYEALSGRRATVDDIAGFIDEARYALWPDVAKKSARAELAQGLKKQRGGVGLRPGRARDSEPPAQGDDAAKAAIGDYLAARGLDPFARRSA